MRAKLLSLSLLCAVSLAGCTSNSNTNQTANAPAQTTITDQTVTTTQPAASPQASGSPQTAVDTSGVPVGTQPNAPASANAKDACALLTSDDVKTVQGEEVKETKPSQRSDSSFAIAQCFYTTPTFTKSISLEVTQAAPGSKTNPRDFWRENFTRAAEEGERDKAKDRDRAKDKDKDKNKAGGEEEEKGAPPQRITGLGDEAYWINSRVSGALYVLKGDRFIRLSLGGTDTDAVRQKKAKTLAQKALSRL
ncbi:MAG TPA: hypothetical protein VE821_16875 [Pyrinomonadaceae bacterium]|nr:hypothetical protein [Pyrinomonadaceae bacterium]